MPKQSTQRRAQGGGRTPNSEPKLQVFKDFAGMNIEQSNYITYDTPAVDQSRSGPGDQTDLPMNYVFLQNNVATTPNKTFETRNNIYRIFRAPTNVSFDGPACLIGSMLYVAKSNQQIGYVDLFDAGSVISNNIPLYNWSGSNSHTWTDLDYYDDKLIATTVENEMWTGDVDPSDYSVASMANAREVPDPTTDFIAGVHGSLTPRGDLQISATMTNDCAFRIVLAHTYVNKYGPTKVSPNTVFYANYPVTEWHMGRYLQINCTSIPINCNIKALEFYYSSDNAMSLLFLGRVDIANNATSCSYNWYGYIDSTSMWPMANLIAPTENYTKGVHASKLCNIDGRMYFWGDSANMQRLYIGGNPGNLLSISPGTGGGFVDVEPGSGQQVRDVLKYKTQSGNSIVTMLCDSVNSQREKRFNLVENSISLSNEQSMKSWQAEQVAGAVGCKSYNGALVCEDGLYSVSRYGLALTTMTMEYNSQIKTTYVSDAIKTIFTDAVKDDSVIDGAILLELDGILYMAFGTWDGNIDHILFCYDIDTKAWWTYSLDTSQTIMNLIHIDYEGFTEGIGIITANNIYLLPTAALDSHIMEGPITFGFLIQTAELSTQMPQQGWQYLSQLEFHFDYLVGDMDIEVRMIDMFGREIKVRKSVSEDSVQYGYVVRMRIDQRVMSYVITMSGRARFRMTHFLARVYTLSNKVGQVWGFDDSISHRSSGSIHPTFKSYNDLKKAIFT